MRNLILGLMVFVAVAAFGLPARGQAPQTLKQRQEERLAAAKEALATSTELYSDGKVATEALLAAARRVYESQLDLAQTDAQKLTAAQEYLKSCEELADTVRQRNQGGLATEADMAAAKYAVAEAQVLLAKAAPAKP